jgi:hypothetical protein
MFSPEKNLYSGIFIRFPELPPFSFEHAEAMHEILPGG